MDDNKMNLKERNGRRGEYSNGSAEGRQAFYVVINCWVSKNKADFWLAKE